MTGQHTRHASVAVVSDRLEADRAPGHLGADHLRERCVGHGPGDVGKIEDVLVTQYRHRALNLGQAFDGAFVCGSQSLHSCFQHFQPVSMRYGPVAGRFALYLSLASENVSSLARYPVVIPQGLIRTAVVIDVETISSDPIIRSSIWRSSVSPSMPVV